MAEYDDLEAALLQPYSSRMVKKRPATDPLSYDQYIAEKSPGIAIPTDAMILESASRGRVKDPYAEEVGPGAGIVRGVEDWLGRKVVDPLAKAGWPKLGAGIAATGATAADMLVPQTKADIAGVVLPFGKAGKLRKSASKGVKDIKPFLESEEGAKYVDSISKDFDASDPRLGEYGKFPSADYKPKDIPGEGSLKEAVDGLMQNDAMSPSDKLASKAKKVEADREWESNRIWQEGKDAIDKKYGPKLWDNPRMLSPGEAREVSKAYHKEIAALRKKRDAALKPGGK